MVHQPMEAVHHKGKENSNEGETAQSQFESSARKVIKDAVGHARHALSHKLNGHALTLRALERDDADRLRVRARAYRAEGAARPPVGHAHPVIALRRLVIRAPRHGQKVRHGPDEREARRPLAGRQKVEGGARAVPVHG